jgi:zinc protease
VPTARAGAVPAPRIVVIDMPGAGQAAVTAALRVPDRADPAYYDLLVANAVLGSGSNGRLFQEVRVKRALSYGASSSLGARAESGLITAAAQTKNESAADVVAIFRTELDRLASEPLDAETVEQRKAFLIGSVSRTAENSRGFASTVAGLVQQGVAPAEAVRVVERISAVTPESATAAARANVAANRASIVVVGDATLFADALRRAHPDLELVQVDSLALDRPTLLAE